ncbi:DUF2442 domain-containing protein, partial [Planctomycetota bacterium]
MYKITRAEVKEDYKIEITFADGTQGTVDLSDLVGKGVFAKWKDREYFQGVQIGSSGELAWDDEIDLCPDALYLEMTGKTPQDVFPSLKHETVHA